MPPFFPVIIVAVIALAIYAIVIGSKRRKQRIEMLNAYADRNGFHFSEGNHSNLEDRFPMFDKLRQGSNRYGYNVMRGERNGRDLWAFDYHYQTTSTNSKGQTQTHHHHFSTAIVDSGLRLEPLFIRTEGFFDKVTEFFGHDDIDFELAEFSRKFYVKAPNRRWAYDVLNQDAMEFLLRMPKFTIEFQVPYVVAHRGSLFKPHEFEAALDVIDGILARIPRDIAAEKRIGG